MKKTTLFLMILLGICLAVGIDTASARAATSDTVKKATTVHTQIEKTLGSVDGVKETRVFAYDDCVIVAVRPNQQLQKTQTDKLEKSITKLVKEKYPKYTSIKVTFSVKVFFAIEQLNQLIDTGKADPDDFFNRPPRPMPKINPAPNPQESN